MALNSSPASTIVVAKPALLEAYLSEISFLKCNDIKSYDSSQPPTERSFKPECLHGPQVRPAFSMTFLSQALIEDATKYPRWPRRYAVLNRRAKWRLSSKHMLQYSFLGAACYHSCFSQPKHQARSGDARRINPASSAASKVGIHCSSCV